MDYKYAVFIGRFQPFHNQHLQVVKHGLTLAEELIIVIGSSHCAKNIKNPFSYQDRVEMIQNSLTPEELEKVYFVSARDSHNDDNMWVTEIQEKVSQITKGQDELTCLTGTYKDASSYYIKLFPNWEFIPSPSPCSLNATDIRNKMFAPEVRRDNIPVFNDVPEAVQEFLHSFIKYDFNCDFTNLQAEFAYIQDYKAKSKMVGLPYEPSFLTADAMVVQSGHVLVVKRKMNPGKGLYALPGGFIKNDTFKAAALRELKEETGIKVNKEELEKCIVEEKVFDYPQRSLRGRTVTTAFYIQLPPSRKLTEVKGADDAETAFWMPFMDVAKNEEKFFEDHCHIIQYFLRRSHK